MWSDHKRGPNLVEYAKSIEPVQTLDFKGNVARIINRYDFVGLEHLVCTWEVRAEGEGVIASGKAHIPKGTY